MCAAEGENAAQENAAFSLGMNGEDRVDQLQVSVAGERKQATAARHLSEEIKAHTQGGCVQLF